MILTGSLASPGLHQQLEMEELDALVRTMCEGGRRVLDDMTDLVRGRNDSNLVLDDILVLLVFVYSSADVRDAFPRFLEKLCSRMVSKEMLVLCWRSFVKMKVMMVLMRLLL